MDEERTEQHRRSVPEPPQKKKSTFWPGLLGGIIGGAVIYLLVMLSTGSVPNQQANVPAQNPASSDSAQHVQVPVDVSTEITGAVEKVASAVVGITNIQTVQNFWTSRTSTQEAGVGSGVIYKKEGGKAYIITNHHVVENAEQLDVTFDNGKKAEGKLIGSDLWTDLAVVEIDAKDVDTVIEFGDSDLLKRGETVMAIGNPLGLGFAGSVTVGVISGKDRSIPIDVNNDGMVDWQADVLQTDAAINPGNSGGALVNMAGQLIGINSMKISQETVEGIGLAIPINIALPIIENLEQTGQVNRPTMGVSLLDLQQIPIQQQRQTLRLPEDVTKGVVVTEIMPRSAAQAAGVEKYDTIVKLDDEEIEDMVGLRKYLYNKKKIGDQLKLTIYRGGKLAEIEMQLKDGNSF